MLNLYKIKQLCQTVVVGLLIGLLWWQVPTSAMADTSVRDADTTPYLKSERLQAVFECIPDELTSKNKDIQDRIARAFGEMSNDYLERTFKLTDDPELTNAEIKFQRCLKSKGLMPEREANF